MKRIATYGGGVNSTAMVLLLMNQGIKIDYLIFADTGGEKPATYKYIKFFNKYLISNKCNPIIKVKYKGKDKSLEQEVLRNKTLPAIVFGFKTCSQKWKIYPSDKYLKTVLKNEDYPAIKYIGYDTDEEHRIKDTTYKNFILNYPLIEAGFDRAECIKYIKACGLPVPPKSACFFCPSSKAYEIRQMAIDHPKLIKRALRIENNAKDKMTNVKGLGRNKSWDDILQQNILQFNAPEISCECHD